MGIHWTGDRFIRKVESGLERTLTGAAIYLSSDIKKSMSKSGGGRSKQGRDSSSVGERSKPGEVPYVQTAFLRTSITWDKPRSLARRVGSRIAPRGGQKHSYPWYLEFGTSKMRKRPWLRPAVDRTKAVVARMIGAVRI